MTIYSKRKIHSDHELYSNNGLNWGSVPEKGIKYSTSQNYSLKNILAIRKDETHRSCILSLLLIT